MIAIVDCNNFYASCERVFNPAMRRRPIVVLSNNDGCIIARSEEAKQLGVPMAEPLYKAMSLIRKHNIQVFSSNYALYGDMSQRVMRVLSQFTPSIELYSIDEAFLDFSGFDHKNLTDYGQTIRRCVRQCTGIPASIGIAPSKTLSKIANRIAKKNPDMNGVFELVTDSEQEVWMKKTPVESVWGVGRNIAQTLLTYNISTAWDLRNASESWIRRQFGVVGARMVRELRGIPCLPLDACPPPKQGIASTRSFGKIVTEIDDLKEAVATYVTRAAEKLRKQNSVAQMLTVFLHTNPFSETAKQYYKSASWTFQVPTDDTGEMIQHALQVLDKIFRKGYRYKKAGVILTGITSRESIQGSLLDTKDRERSEKLMNVLDQINHSMGTHTVHYASTGISQRWRMLSEKRSPNYTTRWNELPVVLAK
ncbi:Y-family DNA polymerase [bacterium]|nr:Y-family DNA polymerase [bacterium]